MVDIGGGSYTLTYTVDIGHTNIADSSDLPVDISLYDSAGNYSSSYTTADASNRPGVDSINPTTPGNLTFVSQTNSTLTIAFGSASSDANFSEYKIFYKEGSSGVSESDSAWTQVNDSDLASVNFNGTTNTTITGLATSTNYVLNIWAYDSAGNSSHATELVVKTNSYPNTPGDMKQYGSDGTTEISNNAWTDEQSFVFSASSTDDNAGDSIDYYFEIASSTSSFETASTVPSSVCSSGTAYNSCSSNIWKVSGTNPDWYNSDWSNRKKITIDHTKVESTETDFVVLISTTDSDLSSTAREDAYDIIFTSSDGETLLDFERESYTSSTGEINAWVKTDISSTTDTVLYMYYGNSSATDTSSSTAVWDSNYRGVWHMNNDPAGAIKDSTSNGNDMTADSSMDSTDLVTGAIGKALNFDGSDDELTNSSPSGYTAPSSYTMSSWVYYASDPSGYDNIYSHTTSSGNYDPQWTFNNTNLTVYDGSAISFGSYSGGAGSWHRIDFIRDGDASNNLTAYIDGVQFGTTESHTDDLLVPTTVYIGASSGDGELWVGYLDEIRYSEIARTPSWLKTEFANQNSPSTFLSIDSEEEETVKVSVTNFPESSEGYKWQVMICDQQDACSEWTPFNSVIPNFKIDLAAPTAPGALTNNLTSNTSIIFNFGATTTEANFSEYKIFYKAGDTAPTESDNLFDQTKDSNLANILFNGAATTTVDSLVAGTQYSFNIWAYDVAGNRASSSFVTITTNASDNPPTSVFNSVAEKTDASGVVDISIEVDDLDNNDEVRVRVEYVAGGACDFTSPLDPTLSEASADISADYGSPAITNANSYQIGTTSAWILTSPGSNTVNFDWDTKTDLPNANGTYCLRITANDGTYTQTSPATTTLYVDNIAPSGMGSLTVTATSTSAVELQFGTTATETNFSEYKIFYKLGDSGVTENDSVWDSGDDSNLGDRLYNSSTSTTITGLNSGLDYVFNIYAYDIYGNVSSSTEVTATTNYSPDTPYDLSQKINGGSDVVNGDLVNYDDFQFEAKTMDVNSGETMSFFCELIEDGETFSSGSSEPSSSCLNNTDYNNCSSKTWKISTTTAGSPDGWYDSGWIYRKKVIIDSDKVESTETDFVVLFNLIDTDLVGKVRSDGYDIIFTSDDGTTLLDYEREDLDSNTGALTAWIKTDISSTTDTVLYMYYGNGGSTTDHSSSTLVWDSGYRGVWHMNNDPTGAIKDSTSNGNDMTADSSMDSTNLIDGAIGSALSFDGSDDELTNSSPSGYTAPSDYTMTAWFYYASDPSGYDNFYSHTTGSGNYDPQWAFNNTALTVYDGSAISFGNYSGGSGSWHRADFVRSGDSSNNLIAYIDGVQFGSVQSHTDDISVPTTVYIGASSGDGELWTGYLDEIRYSEVARSASWLKTEFTNQKSPSTFLSLDSEEIFKYKYSEKISINNIPSSNTGYKWQVIACDSDSACSVWNKFNPTTPNFRIDVDAPTSPGNLSLSSQTANSITINFGTSTSEANFVEYKIFYKEGSSGATESDTEYSSSTDTNLAYIDFNGASTTTISGLSAGTEYVLNIWAYDIFGQKSSANVELVASTNYFPTSNIISASKRINDSGDVDISVQFNDLNQDNLKARVDYVAGSSCDFSSPLDPSLDETDENASSTVGDAKIENDNTYQIGNSSGWIETGSGANTVDFVWLSKTDVPNADGTYCIRITANDGIDDQLVSATTTLVIDNVAPVVPGDLSLNNRLSSSLILNYGTVSSDTNFKEYKIFYVAGASTVDEGDLEHLDANLLNVNFNSAPTTTITALLVDTQYSFKIFAYDDYGNKSSSNQVAFTTNAPPTGIFNSLTQKTDASGRVDISIEVYDKNGDDVEAKLEYVAGASCDFSSPHDPSLDEDPENISADFALPGIENDETYQVGTSGAMIITSSGSNTINFDWFTKTDLPTASGIYCLRLTTNDGKDDQLVLATSTLIVDNVAPSVPGDLSIYDMSGISAFLTFGSQSSDDNFSEYKIFYKTGTSGVSESDSEFNKVFDDSLGYLDYNSATSTKITSLNPSTDYVFNIWAYDDYGNKSNALTEVSSSTKILLSATWRETEDTKDPTAGSYIGRNENIRLRVAIANTGDWSSLGENYLLEYGEKTSDCASISTWLAVPITSTTEHFEIVDSVYLNNMSTTTAKLLNSEGHTFQPGYIIDDTSNMTDVMNILGGYYTELEYSIFPTASAVAGGEYCFRITNNGTEIDTYTTYPELTLAPPATATFNSAAQKTDGTKVTDISIYTLDGDGDPIQVRIDYAVGTSCDFSSPGDAYLDSNTANISADFGSPEVDNSYSYQLGTSSGMILTEFGPNNVDFDWLSSIDLPGIADTYCLQATAYDGFEAQPNPATTTLKIDNIDPTKPGDLTIADKTSNSITLALGTSTIDTNFSHYTIYYKEGSSGVTESDSSWSTSSDANLAYADLNGATTTTISGLNANQQYVFRIWAYDDFGNKSLSDGEVTVVIRYQAQTEDWQWYHDEQNETPTTSAANVNTSPSDITDGGTIKLRLGIREIEGITGDDVKIRLQYSTYSDFSSDVYFVGEIGATSTWTYGNGVDEDNDPVLFPLLPSINIGGGHNESGISTTTYDLPAGDIGEWEFTVRNNGAVVNTTYYFRAYDNNAREAIPKDGDSSYPSVLTTEGSVSYSVLGISAGNSSEGVTANISTTPTSVSFGTLIPGIDAIAIQRFNISTNAGTGYQLFAYNSQNLASNNGSEILPVSSLNSAPSAWPSSIDPSAFGYHTGDDTLSGASPSRFAPNNTYAKFETNMQEVSYSEIPVSDEIIDLVFRANITENQAAGDYETNIVYILVPSFY